MIRHLSHCLVPLCMPFPLRCLEEAQHFSFSALPPAMMWCVMTGGTARLWSPSVAWLSLPSAPRPCLPPPPLYLPSCKNASSMPEVLPVVHVHSVTRSVDVTSWKPLSCPFDLHCGCPGLIWRRNVHHLAWIHALTAASWSFVVLCPHSCSPQSISTLDSSQSDLLKKKSNLHGFAKTPLWFALVHKALLDLASI